MEVRFTKHARRRYWITVSRERGLALASRQGPGYDEYLPHDAVHLLVEIEAGLSGGVFGRLASGQSNIFTPSDPTVRRHHARRESRRHATPSAREDMAISETLSSRCAVLWEMRTGRRSEPPEWFSITSPRDLPRPTVERIIERLDDFASRWHALPVGGSITVPWPAAVRPRRPSPPATVTTR